MTLTPITPTTALAHIYLNADPERMAMVRGYQPGHPLRHCFALPLTAEEREMDKKQLAERIFTLLNIGDDPTMGVPDERAIAYRLARMRSLSVGDVVEVDGTFLAVASLGFAEVPAPDGETISSPWS